MEPIITVITSYVVKAFSKNKEAKQFKDYRKFAPARRASYPRLRLEP